MSFFPALPLPEDAVATAAGTIEMPQPIETIGLAGWRGDDAGGASLDVCSLATRTTTTATGAQARRVGTRAEKK